MNTNKAKERLYSLNLKSLDFARFEVASDPTEYPITDKVENATYEMYCILWFNFISELFDSAEILDPNDIFSVGEVLAQHEKWWNRDPENKRYSDEFRAFVAGELSLQNVERDDSE